MCDVNQPTRRQRGSVQLCAACASDPALLYFLWRCQVTLRLFTISPGFSSSAQRLAEGCGETRPLGTPRACVGRRVVPSLPASPSQPACNPCQSLAVNDSGPVRPLTSPPPTWQRDKGKKSWPLGREKLPGKRAAHRGALACEIAFAAHVPLEQAHLKRRG